MRVREIHIDGFGHFAARRFGPLNGRATVFLGPNEAGKSTLMEFIRTVLFGFRTRAGRPPRGGWPTNYPPLAGGAHGGALTLVDGQGRTFEVRRSGGGRRGRVSVISEGAELGEPALSGLLGNHSREVFDRIFAFALDELHSPDLLSDESVNARIYSAGMGATSLPGALKAIEDRRKEIFLKSGSTQKIHGASARIREIDARLAEVQGNAARYGALTSRLAEIESELAGIESQRSDAGLRRGRQVMLRAGWDDWNALNTAESDLAALPVVEDFPADGVGRLERAEQRVQIARAERESAVEAVAACREGAGVAIDREAIADRGSDIRRVREGRGAFDGWVRDLPEREAELAGYRREFAESLRGLGHDWDEGRLERFDGSIALRQQIAEHGDRIRQATHQVSRTEQAHAQSVEVLKEATEAKERAARGLQSFPDPGADEAEIRERRRTIGEAKSRLARFERHRQTETYLIAQIDGPEVAGSLGGRPGPGAVLPVVGLIAGIALVIAGAVLGGEALYIGIGSGIAMMIGALYLVVSGRSGSPGSVESRPAGPFPDPLEHVSAEIAVLREALSGDAKALGADQIDDSVLLLAEEALGDMERRLADRDRLADDLERAETLVARRGTRVDEMAAAVEEAGRDLESAKGAWRGWLSERGLLESYTPETADALWAQVELCRSKHGAVREWERRTAGLQRVIAEYSEIVVGPLAVDFNVEVEPGDPGSVAAAADALVELFERVQDDVRTRGRARKELEDAERALERRGKEFGSAEKEMADLLNRGGALTAEEFRDRAGVDEKRRESAAAAKGAGERLQRLSGPGSALESLKADLAAADLQSIERALGELDERLEELGALRDELRDERTSRENERGGLMSEEVSSELRMERAVLIEQIAAHARDWSRLTIARGLLEEARAKFERERQPGVVRHAQRFFSGITAGSYEKLYAPLGEQTVTVTGAGGASKQPSELSRGTREQLFLALRFGLIRELGEATEPLPVVVDEVLVNFDPARARRAAAAFLELSRTNQVLVFTCHPQVADHFARAAAEMGADPPAIEEIG